MPDFYACIVTVADPQRADGLARALVQEALAAQATVLPGARTWRKGKAGVEAQADHLVVLHTERVRLEALRSRVAALLPGEDPDFLALDVAAGHTPHLCWIQAVLAGRG